MSATILDVQRYWDSRPCNVRHGRSPVGTLAWSREVTARKYFVEPHIRRFAQFEKWRNQRVLEVGCGIGTDTLEFLRAGARITAVDLSQESLDLAAQRIDAEGFARDRIRLMWINAERWLPLGPFDLAYSFGVLHHTPNPRAALRNIFLSLVPHGELRIMLYARWSLKFLLGEQAEAQAGCPVVKLHTEKAARELLEGDGLFRVVSVEKAHIFPWRVADYVRHRYVKRWPWRVISPERLERYLGHHLLIVARRAR